MASRGWVVGGSGRRAGQQKNVRPLCGHWSKQKCCQGCKIDVAKYTFDFIAASLVSYPPYPWFHIPWFTHPVSYPVSHPLSYLCSHLAPRLCRPCSRARRLASGKGMFVGRQMHICRAGKAFVGSMGGIMCIFIHSLFPYFPSYLFPQGAMRATHISQRLADHILL